MSQQLLPRALWRRVGMTLACSVLFTAGCRRPPQTAAELAKALPPAFTGELHLQGETETHHVRIQARELSIRSEHVLEFNRVDYQIQDAPGAPSSEGEAHIRGTITAPGFDIRLEMLGSTFSGGEDAIRPETFTGKLSRDLQSVDAEWSTGLGQKAKLTLHAAPP
jgi:hypothetical protein